MRKTKLLTLINLRHLRDYYPNLDKAKELVKGHNKYLTIGFYLHSTRIKPDDIADYLEISFLSRFPEIHKIYFQARNTTGNLAFYVLYRSSLTEISYLPENEFSLVSVIQGCIDTHDVDQCLVIGTKYDKNIVQKLHPHPSVTLIFRLL